MDTNILNEIRKIIRQEIDILFESFEFKNHNDTFTPPIEVARTAELAKNIYNHLKEKGTKINSIDGNENEGSGKLKADNLSQKTPQNFGEMKRLRAFFENNAEKVNAERQKSPTRPKGTEEEMMSSHALLVWNLHGGDACKNWVYNKISDKHSENLKTKERLRGSGGAGINKGLGIFKTKHDPTNQRFHRGK